MPVVGPFYTYAQLKQAWINAGGNPAKADIAAAVAMAESGGGINSWNTAGNSAGKDEGLWQINTYYNPRYATFDPTANARGAVAISNNGTNWGPWSTFTNGAYRKFLANGVAPVAVPVGGGTSSGNAPAGTSPVVDQASFWSSLGGWITGNNELGLLGGGVGGNLVGSLGSGIEEGFVHAFWSIFKGLWDKLVKPFFWLSEIIFGPVLMLVAIAILMQQTKVGSMATTVLGVLPGPVGAVAKGVSAISSGSSSRVAGVASSAVKSRQSAKNPESVPKGKTKVTKSTGEKVTL